MHQHQFIINENIKTTIQYSQGQTQKIELDFLLIDSMTSCYSKLFEALEYELSDQLRYLP